MVPQPPPPPPPSSLYRLWVARAASFRPFAPRFSDTALERRYRASVLQQSHLVAVTSGLVFCAWVLVFLLAFSDPNLATTTLGRRTTAELLVIPVLCFLAPLVVSAVRPLKKKFLARWHPALLSMAALGSGIGECLVNSLRGRPVATLWSISAVVMPVALQARGAMSLRFFHSVHCLVAVTLFFVVAPQDEYAQSQRHLYLPANWQLYLNAVLSGVMAMVVSTVMCDLMDRTQRRLFLQRWEAVKAVDNLRKAKERGQALCRNLLPAVYAEKLFSETGEVTHAEMSDLVGVLAIRFAPAHPPHNDSMSLEALKEVRDTVHRIDAVLTQVCAGVVEKVSTHDGLYIVATNVAVPESGVFSEMDPGQRFVHLLRLSLAVVNLVAPAARAGIHIGRCASGVLGTSRLSFDIFGDAVNVATALCGAGSEKGWILCSCSAQAMIPRRGAVWSEAFSVKMPGQHGEEGILVSLLTQLNELRLPDSSAPALPHRGAAERIDLDLPSSSARALSERRSFREGPHPAMQRGVSSERETKSASEPPGAAGAFSTLASLGAPDPKATAEAGAGAGAVKYLKSVENAKANPWTLTFGDPWLEEGFRESTKEVAGSPLVGTVGAFLFAVSFVKEVTLPGRTMPASVAITAIAALLFAAHGVAAVWPRARQKLGSAGAVARLLTAAHVVGAACTITCLLSPARSNPWSELRLDPAFAFMVLTASSDTRSLPLSLGLIASQAAALFFYFATHMDRRNFQLINRRTFPIVILSSCLVACALRFLRELSARRSFLLLARSAQVREVVTTEVERGIRALSSCLPSSIVTSVISKVSHSRAAVTSQSFGRRDAEAAGSRDEWDRVTGLGHFMAAGLLQAVPDVCLTRWPVLTCRIAELQTRYVALHGPQALIRLLRAFFLLAEAAAAEHDCEVIRTTGGTVMICPRISDRAQTDPKVNTACVVSVGEAIIKGAIHLAAAVRPPAEDNSEQEEERSPPAADDEGSDDEVQIFASVAIGPCLGGVVGVVKSFFELVGPSPTQSLAQLELAKPGEVLLSVRAIKILGQ